MPKRFEKVYIEISNVCNLQCEFCPEVHREKKFMERDLFSKIIKDVAPHTEQVCFHLMGEPLVHPLFSDFVGICAGEDVAVNITSNGVLLNEKRAEALLKSAVRQVNFSLHSFEANFPGKDISSYLEKIFSFTSRALRERPDLYVNYRLWNLQDQEAQNSVTEIILEKIDEKFGENVSDLTVKPDVRWKKSKRVQGRLYVHFDSRFQWPHPHHPLRTVRGFCHALSSHLGILADGRVVPCCLDKEGVLELGHCGVQTLEEVLNGTRAVAMREGFKRHELVESLCQKCTFISRFDGKVLRQKSSQSGVNPPDVVVAAQGL